MFIEVPEIGLESIVTILRILLYNEPLSRDPYSELKV